MSRSKARRWAEEDLDASDVEVSPTISPTTYLDTVRRGPQLRMERAQPRCTITGGTRGVAAAEHAGARSMQTNQRGRADFGRQGPGRRQRKHRRPCP